MGQFDTSPQDIANSVNHTILSGRTLLYHRSLVLMLFRGTAFTPKIFGGMAFPLAYTTGHLKRSNAE